MTTVFKGDKMAKAGKGTRAILNTIGKGQLLSHTAGFFPAMGITLAAGAGIGYLLANVFDDDDQNQGLVVEKEDKDEVEQTPPLPVAEVAEHTDNDYHTIKTDRMTWAGIVQAYYPGLVEQCDGKLYGEDGAIRKLKKALSKCEDIDLINASDIPRTLNLPLELEGVKINQNASVQKTKITQKGGHTDIEEAGCKNTKNSYTVVDKKNNQSFTWHDKDAAVDSLKARTGVEEYEVIEAS